MRMYKNLLILSFLVVLNLFTTIQEIGNKYCLPPVLIAPEVKLMLYTSVLVFIMYL